MLFSELGKYIEKTVLLTFVIILLSTAAVVLANFMSASEKKVTLDEQDFKELYVEGTYYQIADNLHGSVEKAFKEKENYGQILANINRDLHECPYFEFMELSRQWAGVRDFRGDLTFTELKENYYDSSTDKTYVNGISVDRCTVEHFRMKVQEGRLFSDEEYYGEFELIPVILGARYKGIYEVGDEMILSCHFWGGKAVVIGILEPNIMVNDIEYTTSLDNYIITPLKKYHEGTVFSDDCYSMFLNKNSGTIFTKLSRDDVMIILDSICSKYDVQGAYYVPMVDNWWQAVFAENIEEVGKSYEKMAFWTGLAAILVLAVYSFVKVRLSYGYFGILMTCGAKMKQIIGIILGEELVIIGFTVVNGLVLSKILCEKLYPKYEFSMTYGTAVIGIISLTGIVFALVGLLRKDIVLCLHDSLQSKK